MSQSLRVIAGKGPRRSHAERNAETQKRIKEAVIDCIAEIGYPRTTGAEITRRAGVTWGAVQHHFGDKDGILMAVLEESFEKFAGVLALPIESDLDLEGRVSIFIDRAWKHFASAHYRTTFEILLNLPDDTEPSWQTEMLGTWNETWRRYFAENKLNQKRTIELMHYAVSVLSGLACSKILEGPQKRIPARELAYLKDTLLRELSPSQASDSNLRH